MKIELINTGAELMLGRVLNTHQQWLCRQLSDLGHEVERQVAVPDAGPAIQQAVREALSRAEVVITTGGLGPTSDDITRDLIAQLLGRPLRLDASVAAEIADFFKRRNRVQPSSTEVQAMVPEGAVVLHNANGTAPGLILQVAPGLFRPSGNWLIMLPGPPRELRPMFTDQVVPWMRERCPCGEEYCCVTLRSSGIGESLVEEKVAGALQTLVDQGMQLGYCARTGEVDVRFVARGSGARERVAAAEKIVRERIGEFIFGQGDDRIEEALVRRLTELHRTVAVAESCTGGLLGHRITSVPGASAVFLGGMITYSNAIKESLLGVASAALQEHGAVSEPVARQMCEGARARLGADYALSVTGIAGPTGGTPSKPVGTVFVGLAGPAGTVVRSFYNPYDRETFKHVTTQQALEMLRREVFGGSGR